LYIIYHFFPVHIFIVQMSTMYYFTRLSHSCNDDGRPAHYRFFADDRHVELDFSSCPIYCRAAHLLLFILSFSLTRSPDEPRVEASLRKSPFTIYVGRLNRLLAHCLFSFKILNITFNERNCPTCFAIFFFFTSFYRFQPVPVPLALESERHR